MRDYEVYGGTVDEAREEMYDRQVLIVTIRTGERKKSEQWMSKSD